MPAKIIAQLYRGAGASSRLIAWFGGKGADGFSHIDAVVPMDTHGYRAGDLLGARFQGGVRVRPYDYLPQMRAHHMEIPSSFEQSARFYDFLFAQIGKPYDWRAIAGFAIARDWRDLNAWFCSELFLAALEYSGRIPRLMAPATKYTPNDAALVLNVLR